MTEDQLRRVIRDGVIEGLTRFFFYAFAGFAVAWAIHKAFS